MRNALARAWPALVIGLIGFLVLVVHSQRYADFISDDALISLRYAERLLEGKGLTWNDGERVEGYSNLAWVLTTAGLGALGLDLVLSARVLGYACLAASMAALVWLHARRNWAAMLAALYGVIALGLTGSFAIWAVGGLEQPMLTALLAWSLALLASWTSEAADRGVPADWRVAVAGLLLGLACWTRPDAPLFVASAATAVLLVARPRASTLPALALIVLPSLLLVAAQLIFRLAYYGDWLPNAAHSKLAFNSHRVVEGLTYWWGGMKPLVGLWLPAAALFVAAIARPHLRPRALLFGLPLLVWSVWVIAIGGDIFPGRRHLVVVVMLLALLASDFWREVQGAASGRLRAGLAVAMASSLLALGIGQWSHDRSHTRARHEIVWSERGESLGRTLRQAFSREQPLLAVAAAGALPFYSKLPSLDMLGLNDRYLALHPPRDLGRGRIAHELGDGDYVLRREPDLVIFCGTSGAARACSRGGREMQADARFAREYTLVTLLGEWPVAVRGKIWVRRHSPRIGLSASGGDHFEIPGLLLSDGPGSLAGLDAAGRIGALILAGEPASMASLALPPGRFRLTLEGSGPLELQVRTASDEARVVLAQGPAPLSFVVMPPGAELELVVQTRAAEAHVRRIHIHRVGAPPAGPSHSGRGS